MVVVCDATLEPMATAKSCATATSDVASSAVATITSTSEVPAADAIRDEMGTPADEQSAGQANGHLRFLILDS